MAACACGSSQAFADCCEPIIRGDRQAQTAEQLLRARYTAHTTGDLDFVVASNHPATRDAIDRAATERWAAQSTWLGLEVVRVSDEGDSAQIEFTASYRDRKDVPHRHHELALFERLDDAWYFRDAAAPPQEQIRREGPKVGRNDPLPLWQRQEIQEMSRRRLTLSGAV